MALNEILYRRNNWKWIESNYPNVIESLKNGISPIYPVHVEIHPHHYLTPLCNNFCNNCTGRNYRRNHELFKWGIDSQRLIQTIKGFKGKVDDIIFSGNSTEPLLYPEIKSAIRAVHDNKEMFSLYSNFYYANRKGVIDELTSPTTSFDYVRISLNAGKRESYNLSHNPDDENAFEVVKDNIIELLRQKKFKGIDLFVHLTYLIDRYNSEKEEIFDIIKWAKDNEGINGIRFSFYQKPLGGKVGDEIIFNDLEYHSLVNYINDLKKEFESNDFIIGSPWEKTNEEQKEKNFFSCNVGKLFSVIGSDGSVYPCTSMAFPYNDSKYKFGNINDEDFWDIWERVRNSENFSLKDCFDCTRAEYDINERFGKLSTN